MSDEPLQVNIRILDKDYHIACPPSEQEDLRASARLLDQRMREIRQTGRVIGTDRIAVMAALNITHELIQLQRTQPVSQGETDRRLSQLQEQVATALAAEPPPTDPLLDASDEKV